MLIAFVKLVIITAKTMQLEFFIAKILFCFVISVVA